MIRTLVVAVFLAILPACGSRTLKTYMRGDMIMDGDMRMAGDMNMKGDMGMSGEVSTIMKTDNTASRLSAVPVYSGSNSIAGNKKVAILDMDGLLVNRNISGIGSLGENPVALFREKLDVIAMDDSVAAIVLRINSPGGGVTASDIMTRDLIQLKTQKDIPIVACIMDVGTAGAYYVATAADSIVAHPTSILGGLGVILNVYNMELALSQFNVAPIHIKAGARIDIASPERMMEQEERELLQAMADEFHDRLIDRVQSTRPATAQHQEELFEGSVFTGLQAQQLDLVDTIGYLDDAIVQARTLAHLPANAPLVMLRRDNDRAYTLFDVTPNTPTMSSLVPLKLPGMDRGTLPTFLYLWQPEPSLATAAAG